VKAVGIEQTIRQALAARGYTCRSVRLADHVSLPGYFAIVVECEGESARFDVFCRLDLLADDWLRMWVSLHWGDRLSVAGQAANRATVKAGAQDGALGDERASVLVRSEDVSR